MEAVISKVPVSARTAPALNIFPTLLRFATQRYSPFAPRKSRCLPGTTWDAPPLLRAGTLQHLYHDLGVMVWVGANDEQVKRIGDILQQVTKQPGGPPRLVGAIHDIKGRYQVYKIDSEDIELEPHWVTQEGEVGAHGLYQLMTKVVSRLSKDMYERVQGHRPEYETLSFRPHQILISDEQKLRGIIHPTANGPRRLPINAHIYCHPGQDHFKFTVQFYTCSTSQYLGSVRFNIRVYHETRGRRSRLPYSMLSGLFRSIPSLGVSSKKELGDVTSRTWQLEREIWSDRVPQTTPKKEREAQDQAQRKPTGKYTADIADLKTQQF